MTFRFEKLRDDYNGYDIALKINGFWLFSFICDKTMKSVILFDHIIWDKYT